MASAKLVESMGAHVYLCIIRVASRAVIRLEIINNYDSMRKVSFSWR